MVSRMAECFGYEDEDEVDAMMREDECLNAVDFFFTVDGPTKIVIAEEVLEADGKISGGRSGMESKGEGAVKFLKVYSGDVPILPTAAVYFMKNKRGKDGDDLLHDLVHLLGRETTREQGVVPVEAALDGEVGELGEEVQPNDVTNFGAIVSPC